MCAAVSASTASAHVCRPVPVGRSSSVAGTRGANASAHSRVSGQRIITSDGPAGPAHGPSTLRSGHRDGQSDELRDPTPPPVVRSFVSLRGRHAFSRVYREGRRTRIGDLTIFSAPGDPGPPQVGFVAGRRVGGAVRRNRAKRRLRAVFRGGRLSPGTAYVVVAGRTVPDVAFDRLTTWVARMSREAVDRSPSEQEEK